MKPNRVNLVPGVVIIVMFAVMIMLVWDYPPLANRFLLMMGGLGVSLGFILVLTEIISKRKQDSLEQTEEKRYSVPHKKLLTTSAWIISLLPAVYLLGFTVSASLYSFVFCKLHEGRWLPSILLGLAMGALIYFGFVMGLKIRFPRPILLPFLQC